MLRKTKVKIMHGDELINKSSEKYNTWVNPFEILPSVGDCIELSEGEHTGKVYQVKERIFKSELSYGMYKEQAVILNVEVFENKSSL